MYRYVTFRSGGGCTCDMRDIFVFWQYLGLVNSPFFMGRDEDISICLVVVVPLVPALSLCETE